MKLRLSCFIVILVCLSSEFLFAEIQCYDFKWVPLGIKASVEDNLGFEVVITANPDYNFSYVMNAKETGVYLGSLYGHYDKASDVMTINMMKTEYVYQKRGIAGALLEAAIQGFPETKKIRTKELTGINFEIVYRRHIHRGVPLIEALKDSPAYKIRAQLGYDKIILNTIDPNYFGFIVEKFH